MNSNETVIMAHNLVKRFGNFTAVDGISFEVRRGMIFGFLGPNGSGKTTTIRMLLGLIQPSSGDIEVLGISVKDKPDKIRPHVGYMSQRFSLYNDLTVLQNLQFYGKAYGLHGKLLKERIERAVIMSGLEGQEKTKTRDLSGGWRQRLALSAAILHHPEIIFLDEPTAGVDPLSRRAFWDLLYQLVTEGVTVFVTTHYMDEADHCHRLAFIQRGRLIANGSPQEIKTEMMRGQVMEIESSDSIKALKVLRAAQESGELMLESVALYGSLVHIEAVNVETLIEPVTRILSNTGIQVENMAMIEPSLEDVFISAMYMDEGA